MATLRRLAKEKNSYHFLQTEGYKLVAGTTPFDATIVNLQTLCASYGDHIQFKHLKVKRINFTTKEVFYIDESSIYYDYLVIAAGSMTRFFDSLKGLRACSHGVKNLKGAFKWKKYSF